ncbi:MAG: hypothetical protein KKE77_01850 [Alphaproteobacteria bacterium]|jgi:hypothetical protein|nr:hypothetical protein [Alphaproteobacteria bacterium]MBU1756656.1 hypothetical protein [Alphaproteobacteria bacterium]MBU2033018.1 hypothetical protein [Alphaproteobacteria bacterium]MBU2339971.1 hypothetical protein [Alphaproteobacteria bacterium]
MRKTLGILAAMAILPLAACDQSVEEAEGDLAEQQLESTEDVLEEEADLADAMGDEAAEETLDAEADAMGEAADDAEAAVEGETEY